MMTMINRVKGKVVFQYYQDGNLFYKCEDGFLFPVPVEDCGSARFFAEEKGMLFMRWISRHMKVGEVDEAGN